MTHREILPDGKSYLFHPPEDQPELGMRADYIEIAVTHTPEGKVFFTVGQNTVEVMAGERISGTVGKAR